MSKRKLRKLVEEGRVSGWDDPRMPTLCGLRRRGYTPRSIRNFCERIGVAKSANTVEYAFLEHCLREDLNETRPAGHGGAPPREADHHQLPRGPERDLPGGEQPQPDPDAGTRTVTFSRHLYVEAEDFPGDPGAQVQAALPQRPGVPPEGGLPHHAAPAASTDENGNVTEIAGRVRPREPGAATPPTAGR